MGAADIKRFPLPTVVDPAQLPLATPSTPGAMSAADKAKLDAITGTNTGNETIATLAALGSDTPITGTNLTNADATIHPANLGKSRFVLPAGTLSAAHVLTFGTTGSPMTDETVWIRVEPQSYAYTLRNGGTGGTTVLDTVIPALGVAVDASRTFDGTDWRSGVIVRVG